ncbi:MAG TPA: glycoside hydrolase family 15 protein [Verrucomicrobiae bacterium]|nr:glycoside hydrolase family 15 protein [Verrucomicrobiae bacterium]
MGRPVVLSNGQLFVGLDENGLVHDFYYPYVGLENLTNARSSQHKIGLWVDGKFSWTDDGSWQISVDFEETALISDVRMHSADLGITIEFEDFIDIQYNALVRCMRITNERAEERDIRLFMHQVFQISRAGRADTALYVPEDAYLLDYKGRCCLLIAGKTDDGQTFDQYAVGNYAVEGKAGTFKDAEDGELSDNAVEHGGVDSVVRFRKRVAGNGTFGVDYWVVAANSQTDAQVAHTYLKYYPVSKRREEVRQHWQTWLSPATPYLDKLPAEALALTRKSMLIVKAHCDDRGSVLASGDSSIFNYGRDYYCYCWPRDAAFAVWPLIRVGIYGEAVRFFEFARDTMHRDGYLMHKYQPDRAIGSTWHPLVHNRHKELAIQEDETASVIYMMGQYYKHSQDKTLIMNFYHTFIKPCATFIGNYIDEATDLPHASYDLWEEKFLTSTYTACSVIAGLEAAAELAEVVEHPDDAIVWRRAADRIRGGLDALYHPDGYFRKGFLLQSDGSLQYDDTVDISSFFGLFMFARLELDDPRLLSMLKHVESRLLNSTPIGGVIRYEHDGYFLAKHQYKGNPWIVCSLWLAQYYQAAGRKDEARALLEWAAARSYPSGALSEQFDPDTGTALGVTPLVWSHSETVNTMLDLTKPT